MKCVGGELWSESSREMMQDLEWQSVERGIGAVEANWRKKRRARGDVTFMMRLWVVDR